MEPKISPPENQTLDRSNKFDQLNKITPLSKYLAIFIFIFMPFVGAWVGYQHVPKEVIEVEKVFVKKDKIDNELNVFDNESIKNGKGKIFKLKSGGSLVYNPDKSASDNLYLLVNNFDQGAPISVYKNNLYIFDTKGDLVEYDFTSSKTNYIGRGVMPSYTDGMGQGMKSQIEYLTDYHFYDNKIYYLTWSFDDSVPGQRKTMSFLYSYNLLEQSKEFVMDISGGPYEFYSLDKGTKAYLSRHTKWPGKGVPFCHSNFIELNISTKSTSSRTFEGCNGVLYDDSWPSCDDCEIGIVAGYSDYIESIGVDNKTIASYISVEKGTLKPSVDAVQAHWIDGATFFFDE